MTKTIIKFKVAFVTGNNSFAYFYRGLFPLRVLEKWGFIEWRLVKWQDGDDKIHEAMEWADIFIFQSASDSNFIQEIARIFREDRVPKVLIAEFDDDISNIHPSNLGAYQAWGTREVHGQKTWIWKNGYDGFDLEANKSRVKRMFEAVSKCDSVIVTGEPLARVFRKHNPNVHILPNFVSPEHMERRPRLYLPEGKVLIGWQGGDSHYDDLAITMPALEAVKKRYGDRVQFVFMGAAFLHLYKRVDGYFIPWTKPERFYNRYNYYLPDIALAPLINNDFNRCKSAIKFYEAAWYGVPTVAAKVTPYKEEIMHYRTGFLYERLDECRDILGRLVEDELFRKKVGAEAQRWVEKHRNIQLEAYRWYNLFVAEFDRKLDYLSRTQLALKT